MKKRILIMLLVILLVLPIISAWEFDNIKNIKETKGLAGYFDIEIINAFGLGDTLWSGTLDSNTEQCGRNCNAVQTITLYEKGSLVDDVIFERIYGDGTRGETNIRNYQIYIKTGEQPYQVDDYEYQCEKTGKIFINGTQEEICLNVKIGNHTEYIFEWEKYNLGTELDAGIYEIKLEGEKKPSWTIDWIYKIQGETLNEWAIWGESSTLSEGHRETLGDLSSADNRRGYEIYVNYNITLISVAIAGGSTAVSCFLEDAGLNQLDAGTFNASGDCELNYNLTENTVYVLRANAAYQRSRVVGECSFPINNTYIDWTAGYDGDVRISTDVFNMGNITFRYIFSEVTLNSPEDNYVSILNEVEFNASAQVGTGANLTNMSLWHNGTGIWHRNQTEDLVGTTNTSILNSTFSEGVYLWSYEACDTDGDCGCDNENRKVLVDITPPSIIINRPQVIEDFGSIYVNQTLNWTIEAILDSVWFEYNGTNTTVYGLNNQTNFKLQPNLLNLTLWANDSSGRINSSFIEWSYEVFENSQTFNSITTEGNLESFLANLTIDGLTISTATLFYGNTSISGESFIVGNNTILRKQDFFIPNIVNNQNVSFNWQILLSDTSIINLTIQNQSVFNFSIDDCSTNTNVIYNFTIVDEEDQDPLVNNSLEILVNIYSMDRNILISNYSESFNISSINLCVNRNLSNFTSAYLLDSTVKYSAQDHETEYYNIINYNLTNQSKVQNIILYDLLTSDSTEFQLTFTGSNFLAVENALIFVKRQYISENVFKTVELPKTDSNGQTVLHLVRNDIIYNFEVMKDGVVIGNFENMIAFCDDVVIGDCKIILSSVESGEAIFNYDDALGITYTDLIYDNVTRIITFNFLTTDGSVKTVLMNATRNDIFGNRSICSASLVSSGGTLTCEVPSYIEDSTIIAKVFVDGKLTLKDYIVLSEFNYGKAGYFVFFIYMLAFILMFSKDKTIMLIGIVVGFIVGISLGLISGKLMGIGASGIWLIIVVILMVWKLNKERPD